MGQADTRGAAPRPADARRERVARRNLAGRVAVTTFVALSLVAMVAGWVLTQVDAQYEASPAIERGVVGVAGGAFVVVVLSPLTALVSLVTGGITLLPRRPPMATMANPDVRP